MTDETLPPEDGAGDHEDDVEPTLGGEVHPDPAGPADLLPLERYGPEDLTLTSTDADAGRGSESPSESVDKGNGELTT